MKKALALLMAATMLLGFAACGAKTDAPGTTAAGAATDATTAAPGPKKDTVTIALNADIANLDPFLTSSATDNLVNYRIYRGLTYVDAQSQVHPSMAKSWDISEDGLTYTFHLRDDITFHNGEKFTSDDVVFSVERAAKSPYMASTFALYCTEAKAIDDYTVELYLKQPYAPFLSMLEYTFVIHNREAWEAAGSDEAFLEHPIGCGPYQYVERKPGVSVTLKKFDQYYGGGNNIQPEIENVVFKIITDPSTTAVAVETGEIDLAGFGSSVPASNLPLLEENSKLKVDRVDSINTAYIIMNLDHEPFNNVDLRKAIGHAIDKQFVIDVTENGSGTIAKAMTNSLMFGFSDKLQGYPYDVELAKQYLEKAGFPGGAGLPTFEFKLMEGKTKAAAEAIQAQLRDIGINIELTVLEKNAYLGDVLSGNYDIGLLGITLGTDSAVYSNVFASMNAHGGLNTANWVDDKTDQLFSAAEVSSDPAERQKIYEELFLYLEDCAVYIPLYHPQSAYIHNKDLDLGTIYPADISVAEMRWK